MGTFLLIFFRMASQVSTDMSLDILRTRIEETDRELISLISRRMEIAQAIADEKERQGLPVRIPDRAEVVLTRAAGEAEKQGLDPEQVRRIFSLLIEMSEDMQRKRRKEEIG